MRGKSDARISVAAPTLPVYISPGHPILYPLRNAPVPEAAQPAGRAKQSGTAAVLALRDMLRLPGGGVAELRLLAMASDLWAERPEANDPTWITAEWNGLTIGYQLDV